VNERWTIPTGKEGLIEQATTVDSGVAQVIRKQGVGWAYIKAAS